jgi:hypothetical protein
VNTARTFKQILFVEVKDGQPEPDGTYTIIGELSPPLTDEELRLLTH